MRNFLYIFILLMLSFACQKKGSDPDTPPVTKHDSVIHPIDPELKSQEFNIGSYWIYKNDSTNVVDCTYVYDVKKGLYLFYMNNNGVLFFREYYTIYYYKPFDLSIDFCDKIQERVIIRTNNLNPTEFNDMALYVSDGTSWGIIHLDSIGFGSHTFYDVQKARPCDSSYCPTYYTAKSVGIVKYNSSDESPKDNWTLIKWKIVY
jgi:hypothetical protein